MVQLGANMLEIKMPWEHLRRAPLQPGESEKALQRKQCLNWNMQDVLYIKEEGERMFKAMFQSLKESWKNGTFEELRSSACLNSTMWDRKSEK